MNEPKTALTKQRINFDGTLHVCAFNADGHCTTHATTREAPFPSKERSPDAFEQMPIVDQIRLAAICWRDNGERGACSPSAESLIRQANDADRWADAFEEHEQSFDLRWKADMRAIKRWQEAHPGNDHVWPDHADLCVWLMDQLTANSSAPETSALQQEITFLRKALNERGCSDWVIDRWVRPFASADKGAASQEDKADLLSMAALVARKGRESLKANHKVEGEILLRAAEALHALSETRVTVPRSSAQETSADPNPLDPTNRYFRKCLKGHVSYSASFPECPSCKIERERNAQKAGEKP